MYPSYETIAAQSGNYPFIEVYQFSNAGVGTVGRGSENKVPFVATVSLNEKGHPVYLKLARGIRISD